MFIKWKYWIIRFAIVLNITHGDVWIFNSQSIVMNMKIKCECLLVNLWLYCKYIEPCPGRPHIALETMFEGCSACVCEGTHAQVHLLFMNSCFNTSQPWYGKMYPRFWAGVFVLTPVAFMHSLCIHRNSCAVMSTSFKSGIESRWYSRSWNLTGWPRSLAWP